MQYKPHDYQKFAVDFIETHPEAAVLLECGLGKTSITLTALNDMMFDRFEVHKVLIIAPIRVCRNSWAAEIEKWDHLRGMTNTDFFLGQPRRSIKQATIVSKTAITVERAAKLMNKKNKAPQNLPLGM